MLTRLTYASQISPSVSSSDIDELVVHAASFNKSRQITGIIAIEDGNICQTLEGPTDEVSALFHRIRLDGRHTGVVELERKPIQKRRFEDWGMARGRMVEIVKMAFGDV
jgi:hypothetical protein